MTQLNLSQLTGIGQSYVALIESGTKFPTLEVLEKICFALDIRMSDLFRECESITWSSPDSSSVAAEVHPISCDDSIKRPSH